MMSKEDSDSEEEILVYAEFDDSVNIDKYRTIHILGADDKNPIIQLDETFFMGKYEHSLGTYMFFEKENAIQGKDPLFDAYPEKSVKYVYKTKKLLSMEHAYVTPKDGKESNPPSQAHSTVDDVQPVTFTDVEQATRAFKPYFTPEPSAKEKKTSQPNFIEITIDTSRPQAVDDEDVNLQNSDVSNEYSNRNDLDLLESTSEQNPDDVRIVSFDGDMLDISNLDNTNEIEMEIIDETNPVTILD